MNSSAFILFLLVIPLISSAQPHLQPINLDIDNDGAPEELLFYNEDQEWSDEDVFTRFCVLSNQDTFCVNAVDAWTAQEQLYYPADLHSDSRFGIFHEEGGTFIWLTEMQFGCCLNTTTVLEWTGFSLRILFSEEFETRGVEVVDGRKYLKGYRSLTEIVGHPEGDYYYSTYFPIEYRLLADGMKVDSALTQRRNQQRNYTIEESVDVFSATMLHIKYAGHQVLLSDDFLINNIDAREYGILSLVKLDSAYFKEFTKQDLRVARNELFAWHGYDFRSDALQAYFNNQDWYQPRAITSTAVLEQLSEIELYNVELIEAIEKERF